MDAARAEAAAVAEDSPATETAVPEGVDYASLLSGTTRGGKVKPADAWAVLWGFAFRVPALGGLGAHWPITDGEAKDLGNATAGLIASLPAKRRKAWEQTLQRTMPGLVFAATLAIVVHPRASVTLAQLRERAERIERERANAARAGESGVGERAVAAGTGRDQGPDSGATRDPGRAATASVGADEWPIDGRSEYESEWPQ